MERNNLIKEGVVVAVILLFVSASVIPSTGTIIVEKTSFPSLNSNGYIQDLIDNASSGDTIYIPSGTYYESIIINKSISLIGEDRNTTIIDGSNTGDVVYITADWVNISSFTIRNSGNYRLGIDIKSDFTTIADNNILNNWVGIDIGDWPSNSNNNTIKDNNISSNKWNGIWLTSSNGNRITGNTITSNVMYGLVLGYSSNNFVLNNSFFNDGLKIYYSYQNTVINNTVNDKPLVCLENKSDTIIDVDEGQVILINCSNITIQNQEISNTDVGIELWNTHNCLLTDSTISNNNVGILFNGVLDSIINQCVITENHYGVRFGEEDCFGGGGYNVIQNNTINDNSGFGIYFSHDGGGFLNMIWENNICSNNIGIFMIMSSKNHIFSNNIMSNVERGVALEACLCGGNLNRVFHNNFIYNGDENGQASNGDLFNYWDDGYPSGGNFWSDYTGVDNFSGPNQNIPGSDGIGDTPYTLINAEDNYPLMEVWDRDFPPIAEFNWTPIPPDPGELILFNASDSYDYDGYITLYEWDWDNDEEFDVNFTSPYTNHTFEEAGYYLVTLRVHSNNSENDTKRNIVRIGNKPPHKPYEPTPEDGATNVSNNIKLRWTSGDPDGDPVTYDVYFGTSSSPPQVTSNQSDTSYDPGELLGNMMYYWQIVAWDHYGASTEGSVWCFTTIPADLDVSIIKPIERRFYFRNKPLFSLPRNTIIVGYIDITVEAISDEGIEKVEFYINNKLKDEDFTEPYSYRWRALIPLRYRIKAVAYDNIGNNATSEMTVWKFF
ncbi:MAG: right-handed parallel beta-helix repeat-containing protein [Thermoplasmatales archaeon]|nr:MAG: right-handed parallel beta-helix repeat-containing protein [Thermoplasmatales archaeon]